MTVLHLPAGILKSTSASLALTSSNMVSPLIGSPVSSVSSVASPSIREFPIHPADFVILAVRVVVSLLRTRDLVPVRNHRHALGERQRCDEVAHGTVARVEDGRVVGRAFDAPVPADVVVIAVLIVLAVGLVVLLLVTDE